MKMTACNICGNDLLERRGRAVGRAYAPGRSFNLFRCKRCQLVFLNPQPDPGELDAFYPEDYGPHDPGNIPGNRPRMTLMEAFREFVFSGECAGNDRYRALKSLLGGLYNTLAYRSIPPCIGDGVLLDVGCGLGAYLCLLRSLGWRVYGIESNRRAALYAQERLGLDVKGVHFEDAVFPENFFDVITMWHSLEHFPDPKRILLKANRLLKPGGLLLIGVPNDASMDRRLFGQHWNGAEIPLHLFHFNPISLRTALEITGFRCEKVTHTIRPSDFASSLRNLLGDRVGAAQGPFSRNLTFLASLLPTVLFALLRRASIIIAHARKVRTAPSDRPSAISPNPNRAGGQ